ncbi:transposase, partial [Corallococcus sp. RDP092CA]|uniref:IS66 family transposase n=1 Tax=Corallococcus sp. RDP092CA TaxID=3109369 RepID=UPI0035AE40AC
PRHPPKSPMGQALSYATKQWDSLTRFVEDARLPLDNNRSEAALRKAALGRKNFLFVGHEAAGENLAGLYALVATCEANGVNPEA